MLRGARRTLAEQRPVLWVEEERLGDLIGVDPATKHDAFDVVSLLRGHGYRCALHQAPLHPADNFNGLPQDSPLARQFRTVVSQNMLCVHRAFLDDEHSALHALWAELLRNPCAPLPACPPSDPRRPHFFMAPGETFHSGQ